MRGTRSGKPSTSKFHSSTLKYNRGDDMQITNGKIHLALETLSEIDAEGSEHTQVSLSCFIEFV